MTDLFPVSLLPSLLRALRAFFVFFVFFVSCFKSIF